MFKATSLTTNTFFARPIPNVVIFIATSISAALVKLQKFNSGISMLDGKPAGQVGDVHLDR